ncbi:hypothetical protein AZKH_p0395 (plasmid) [Azoarcus sp. KH32C]|nr:hypothetical protein AZKH_p0395 [Azoarcus sp. KH32C]
MAEDLFDFLHRQAEDVAEALHDLFTREAGKDAALEYEIVGCFCHHSPENLPEPSLDAGCAWVMTRW